MVHTHTNTHHMQMKFCFRYQYFEFVLQHQNPFISYSASDLFSGLKMMIIMSYHDCNTNWLTKCLTHSVALHIFLVYVFVYVNNFLAL